jgi:hypothetical protein
LRPGERRHVEGQAFDGGHILKEERPQESVDMFKAFFTVKALARGIARIPLQHFVKLP